MPRTEIDWVQLVLGSRVTRALALGREGYLRARRADRTTSLAAEMAVRLAGYSGQ